MPYDYTDVIYADITYFIAVNDCMSGELKCKAKRYRRNETTTITLKSNLKKEKKTLKKKLILQFSKLNIQTHN